MISALVLILISFVHHSIQCELEFVQLKDIFHKLIILEDDQFTISIVD